MCCAYGPVDTVNDLDEGSGIFPGNIDNTYYFDAWEIVSYITYRKGRECSVLLSYEGMFFVHL
jgi:hypothetical protein